MCSVSNSQKKNYNKRQFPSLSHKIYLFFLRSNLEDYLGTVAMDMDLESDIEEEEEEAEESLKDMEAHSSGESAFTFVDLLLGTSFFNHISELQTASRLSRTCKALWARKNLLLAGENLPVFIGVVPKIRELAVKLRASQNTRHISRLLRQAIDVRVDGDYILCSNFIPRPHKFS